MIPRPRLLLRLAPALVAASALAVPAAASAAAAKEDPPCWKAIVNDWYDPPIDGTYPIHCYRDALANIPDDLKNYTGLGDDIERALRERLHQPDTGNDQTPSIPDKTGGAAPPDDKGDGGTPTPLGRDTDGVLAKIGPDDAESFPLPLLILGGLAVILMLAGAAAFVARRLQARRVPLPARAPARPSQR